MKQHPTPADLNIPHGKDTPFNSPGHQPETIPPSKDSITSDDLCSHVLSLSKDTDDGKFPVESFPFKIQELILSANDCLGFPIDYLAASMLFAVSVSVGNTYRIEVKNGWSEGCVLYIALVGKPGVNKSAPLAWAIDPISKADSNSMKSYQLALDEYRKCQAHVKPKSGSVEGDTTKKPVYKKHILSDTTPEGLASVHMANPRGLGLCIDELAGWVKNFNRYNKGSEMEFWLSSWSGKPINIDRKTGEPIHIDQPFISVSGTIQPGILLELAKDNRSQNGFIDRILFVNPTNLAKQYWNDAQLDKELIEYWNNTITKILSIPTPESTETRRLSKDLKFTPDANDMLRTWQKMNTDLANKSENEDDGGIYSKMEIYVVRLSLLLEVFQFGCGESVLESVGIESVEGAIKLVEYFKKSAFEVRTMITKQDPMDKLDQLHQDYYFDLPDEFTTAEAIEVGSAHAIHKRDIQRFFKNRGLFKKMKHGRYRKV